MGFYPGDLPGSLPGPDLLRPGKGTVVTERVYAGLPDVYRDADAVPPDTYPNMLYPLMRYLSLTTDQLDEVTSIADAIDTFGGVSQLVDPARAWAGWLPWLAQLVGVVPPAGATTDRVRWLIGHLDAWRTPGTVEHIADAARLALTPRPGVDRAYVRVMRDPANPWHLSVVTDPTETPSSDAVIDAISAADARPAGVLITIDDYLVAWSTVEAKFPTWDAIEAAGSWETIETTRP